MARSSRPCLRFVYALGSENVPSQAVARKLGMKVQKRSIYAGFEHLIFGAARRFVDRPLTAKADRQRARTRFFNLDADAVFLRPRVAPRPFRFVAPAPRAETVIFVPAG